MPLHRLLRKSDFEGPSPDFEERSPSRLGPVVHDDSNWLVSYADIMTLLCGFFIILFSLSKLDDPQYEKVKKEIARSFKGRYEEPNQGLGEFATRLLQEAGLSQDTTIRVDARGVTLTFQSMLFFDTLSAEVKPTGQAILLRLIEAIFNRQLGEQKFFRIVVEGHTDSRPILSGIYPSNWELSSARASRVIRMFQDRGFPPDRLTAIGYGETRPVAGERRGDGSLDEQAMARNRRVVLRILEPKGDTVPLAEGISPEAAAHSEEGRENPSSQAKNPANPAH